MELPGILKLLFFILAAFDQNSNLIFQLLNLYISMTIGLTWLHLIQSATVQLAEPSRVELYIELSRILYSILYSCCPCFLTLTFLTFQHLNLYISMAIRRT